MIDYASKQYLKPTLLKRILQWLRQNYYTEISHDAWQRQDSAVEIIKTIESLDAKNLRKRQDAAKQAMQGNRLLDGKPWSRSPTVLVKK